MNDLLDLLKLQGEIRLKLVTAGIDEEESLDLAAEILDAVVKSPVVRDEAKGIYDGLAEED